jgi:hypothetical protein
MPSRQQPFGHTPATRSEGDGDVNQRKICSETYLKKKDEEAHLKKGERTRTLLVFFLVCRSPSARKGRRDKAVTDPLLA